ncbi:hypothetical protein CTE07_21530 [Chitinophaga terrae (ex Kim and Jung 2007)]|nr:hypothetical protein CTE07_21530 [Chitinophaga terrae (ex Kim and Jung 2007)]
MVGDNPGLSMTSFVLISYLAGVIVMLALFVQKMLALRKLVLGGKRVKQGEVTLIYIGGLSQPFSFFKLIFLPSTVEREKDTIVVRHELLHAQDKHSLDIIILEIFKIISWFVPVVYLVQRRLKLIHEYIVDASMIADGQTDYYINHVLKFSSVDRYQTLGSNINYKALLKNRIIMMYTTPQKPIKKLKYLLPLLLLTPAVYASSHFLAKDYSIKLFESPSNHKERKQTEVPNATASGPALRLNYLQKDTIVRKQSIKKSVKNSRSVRKKDKSLKYVNVVVDEERSDTTIDRNGNVTVTRPLILEVTPDHP